MFSKNKETKQDQKVFQVPQQLVGQDRIYIVDKQIGTGSHSQIYRGLDLKDKKLVAIKVLERGQESKLNGTKREIINHSSLRHPQVIQFYEIVMDKNNLYIIMEYANKRNLQEYMIDNGGFSEDQSRRIFQQLIFGLEYLHLQGLKGSRDLKLQNCLVDAQNPEHPIIKLCDFGIQKCEMISSPHDSTIQSLQYVAPEIILQGHDRGSYDSKQADLWSCGVFLYVMLFKQFPFTKYEDSISQRDSLTLKRILDGDWCIPDYTTVSYGAQEIIRGLIQQDPHQRLTIDQVYDNPWFNENLPQVIKSWNKDTNTMIGTKGVHGIMEIIEKAKSVQTSSSSSYSS